MKRFSNTVLWTCLLSSTLSGCGTIDTINARNYGPGSIVSRPTQASDNVDGYGRPQAINLDAGVANQYYVTASSYNESDKTKAKLARNNLQDLIMARSEELCQVRLGQIAGMADVVNFGLGSTATVLGGIGAIVTGTNAARALSGSAGIFSGLRAEADADIYQNYVKGAVNKAITDARKTIDDRIRQEQTKDIADYSVERAVRDAVLYHSYCSFEAGMRELAGQGQQIDTPKSQIEQRIATLRSQVKANVDMRPSLTDAGAAKLDKSNADLIDQIDRLTKTLGEMPTH